MVYACVKKLTNIMSGYILDMKMDTKWFEPLCILAWVHCMFRRRIRMQGHTCHQQLSQLGQIRNGVLLQCAS